MSEFSILVQKFGGSSVATEEKIKAVASFIKSFLTKEKRICVVVSAMGHTTDNLLSLAKKITDKPVKRELDMLLSCGERTSMALLSIALNDIGVKSISLTGSQSGIITDNNHREASITEVKPIRVLESFKEYQVVIIAGFQGVSEEKEITTLKRGGSDTTAVAMAAGLNAYACEIYTDVDGVMTADPNIAQKAKTIPTLNYELMNSMALYGAKVLAYDACILAKEMGIIINVAKTGNKDSGTQVSGCKLELENLNRVFAISSIKNLAHVKSSFDVLQTFYVPKMINSDYFLAYLDRNCAKDLGEKIEVLGESFCLLCIHHNYKNPFLLLPSVHTKLKAQDIKIEEVACSSHEVFVVIKEGVAKKALEILHESLIVTE